MKELKLRGENWHLSGQPEDDTPELQLQRIVTASAVMNAGTHGVNATVNAYLSACLNVVIMFELDPAELQRMLRAMADQTPEAVAAQRLAAAAAANSEDKPS